MKYELHYLPLEGNVVTVVDPFTGNAFVNVTYKDFINEKTLLSQVEYAFRAVDNQNGKVKS